MHSCLRLMLNKRFGLSSINCLDLLLMKTFWFIKWIQSELKMFPREKKDKP